jgi:ribosomal protein S18 acetylase RimI-like enzyme
MLRDPPAVDLRAGIAEAYSWLRALGNRAIESRLGLFVVDPEMPDIWDANHLQRPRAQDSAEVDLLLATMDEVFAHCEHRMVLTDGMTADAVVARLLADGFQELDATIQMALTGDLAEVAGPPLEFAPVNDEAAWAELYRLMRADHEEARRRNDMILPESVTRGMIMNLRRKAGPMTFYLAALSGRPVAYGAKVECPNGLGMIEDVFTLPAARNRGIASALIAHLLGRLRTKAPARPVFLGAHSRQKAKHLYRRLGFQPVTVTREFLRRS